CRLMTVIAVSVAACGGGGTSDTPPTTERPPTIASFTATPTDAVTGHRVTLNWSVDRAASLSISGVGPVTRASVDVSPAADTDYVLTASNAAGSVQAHSQVTIYPLPQVWFAPYAILGGSGPGSVDYFDLFNSDAPWAEAAAHIQVFKIYEGVLTY